MIVLLTMSLFTFTSFDGVATLQRYSSFVIFMKCTKTGEAFLHCEELVVVAFVETNVDASFDSI